jgi:NADH dehydrogenase
LRAFRSRVVEAAINASLHHVVLVGGGFAGLKAAQLLSRQRVRITLIDRQNYHLFQPLLYQVATGMLSPANIAAPLRTLLKSNRRATVLRAEVTGFDVVGRRVLYTGGTVGYDTLIVAAGARHHYFGHPEWEQWAPGLKTIEDAEEIRRRVLSAFEEAELEPDAQRRRALLTFVVIGGGPTGVELAGQLGELARQTLRPEFRNYRTSDAQIVLVEGADQILPTFPADLSASAAMALGQLGVEVRVRAKVVALSEGQVTLEQKGRREQLAARTVLWAAGVQASPLSTRLAEQTGAQLDRLGRVVVQPDLTVPGHPEIFVLGDQACAAGREGKPLPGVALVAMQQGAYAARLIAARLQGETLPPFEYEDRGSMATVGRNAAVVDLGWTRFSGFFAWAAWLSVHLLYLVEHANRILVLVQWGWSYATRNRAARLITGTFQPAVAAAAARSDADGNNEGSTATSEVRKFPSPA